MNDHELAALVGLDLDDPADALATELVAEDRGLMARLVDLRKARGLSQADVASRLGISQPSVQSFERPDNDPRLSTIRRYAAAIGGRVRHAVVPVDDDHEGASWSVDLSRGRLASEWTVPVAMQDGIEDVIMLAFTDVAPDCAMALPKRAFENQRRVATWIADEEVLSDDWLVDR